MLAKDTAVMERIFQDEDKAELNPRQQAIFDFSVKLSQTPPDVSKEDLDTLKANNLDPAEILDLVLSSALFGWANRLMHTLGDPVENSE